ncbi:hypothetical protein HJG54_17885 [Leptolyngbya sp. NK1-12]|uniref:Uncharacterized protein n=1 Tax=Leptolyngbya sp. NK1-12 TaxID=2547451 RepID=A0AA96WG16_9CYAN|nr:hypothetical protein [Leptolyngbya sp. NK1-12]WNZ24538.1 hypothetical protein HJG54_17885 [Leptolyngbya sp. NK1-12]
MEFLVDSIERDGEAYCVRGACTHGKIDIGTIFSKAYKKIKRFSNNQVESIRTENHRVVSLRVEKIIAYRHSLDSLPQGMSGEIYLVGEGGYNLNTEDTLASE